MTIYLIANIMIVIYAIFGKVNANKRRKKCFLIVSFGILTLIAMLRKYTIGIDLEVLYEPKFREIANCEWAQLFNIKLELGYVFFCKILSYISTDPQILIIVSSLITIPIYGIFIYRNSKNVAVSTTLYIFLNLFFMSLNIVRQEIAVAIVLIAYEYLIKGKNIKFILLIILATLFHSSAILCLCFMLFYKYNFTRKTLLISIVILGILSIFYKQFLLIFSDISSILGIDNNKSYSTYLENETYGVGIINLNSISTIVFALMAYLMTYYYLVYLNGKGNSKKLNLWMFCTMAYFIIATVSTKMVIIGRLSYYFLPFLLLIIPEAIQVSKVKNNKVLIYTMLYGFIIAKYIYIFVYLADILFGVMPYEFFWQ